MLAHRWIHSLQVNLAARQSNITTLWGFIWEISHLSFHCKIICHKLACSCVPLPRSPLLLLTWLMREEIIVLCWSWISFSDSSPIIYCHHLRGLRMWECSQSVPGGYIVLHSFFKLIKAFVCYPLSPHLYRTPLKIYLLLSLSQIPVLSSIRWQEQIVKRS